MSATEDADALFKAAQEAFKAGRVKDARKSAEELVRISPTHVGGFILLANLAFLSKDHLMAEAQLRHAIEIDPNNLEAVIGLASLLANGSRPLEAIALCEAAIALQPDLGAPYYHQGRAYLMLGKDEEAVDSLNIALNFMPKLAPGYHCLGVAQQNLGRSAEAAASFRNSIALDPHATLSHGELGNLLLSTGDTPGAVVHLRKAAEGLGNTPQGLLCLARADMEEGLFAQSEESLHTILRADPQSVEALVLLARIEFQKGRFDEANGYLTRILEIDPTRQDAICMLIAGKKVTSEDRPLLETLETLSKETQTSLEEWIPIEYSLGKAFDDLTEYEQAIAHYHEGNRLSKEKLSRSGIRFDRLVRLSTVNSAINGFTAERLKQWHELGDASEKPIFIVGMPRSGTTLLEQVISSHPQVGAAGELGTWTPLTAGDIISGQRMPSKTEAQTWAQEFLKKLETIAPGCERVTEKTPQNYLILGPIAGLFPHARILHCKRDPVDTCLSIYTTLFMSGPEYAHDMEDLAFVYQQYEHLMTHWKSILPPTQLMDVEYEELVSGREPLLRRTLEFLGLDWNDVCLAHERNEHAISTPSVWQARQPVYSSSIGRWKRYEPWIQPLMRLAKTS